MPTKQEERAANKQRREELVAGQRQPVSKEVGVDYPLTAPAEKARAARRERDEEGAYAKPHPVGAFADEAAAIPPVAPQSDAEFTASGGKKLSDNSTDSPSAKNSEASKASDEKAKSSASADEKSKSK